MNILTLQQIKDHLRIEESTEDTVLTLMGDAVEQEALNFMERTYDSILVEFGAVPADIKMACLAHIASMYTRREDTSDRSISRVPYCWDNILIKYKPKSRI